MTAAPQFEELRVDLAVVEREGLEKLRSLELKALAWAARVTYADELAASAESGRVGIDPRWIEKVIRDGLRELDGRRANAIGKLFGVESGSRHQSRSQRRAGAASIYERAVKTYIQNPAYFEGDVDALAERIWLTAQAVQDAEVMDGASSERQSTEQVDRTPPTPVSGGSRQLLDRKNICESRWVTLTGATEMSSATLGTPSSKACVYATGSMARGEASAYSDLDIFIVDDFGNGKMNRIEYAHLITFMDSIRDAAGFRDFSRQGAFLERHSLQEMKNGIGNPDDDASNRMTARMLLLVNSRAIHNHAAHAQARGEILDLYFRDNPSTETPSVPAFLFNDLNRLWATMTMNFEHYNPPTPDVTGSETHSSFKRRSANLKLKTSQMLGCLTPVLGMLDASTDRGLSRHQAASVFATESSARIARLIDNTDSKVSSLSRNLLALYCDYLEFTNCSKSEMTERLAYRDWADVKEKYSRVGDLVYQLLHRFYEINPNVARYAVV